MSDSPNEKSAHIPVFDGKLDSFQIWWRRFKAYANIHRFSESLAETGDPDLPTSASIALDPNIDEDKPKILAKKRNALAVAAFTMAFEGENLMMYIDKGCTADWPEGHAQTIVKALIAKYKPTDIMSKAEMKQAMRKVTMKSNEDPVTLFTQLSSIEQRFKKTIDLDDKLAVILEVCPKEYKSVLTTEQRYKGAALTIENLEEVMTSHF